MRRSAAARADDRTQAGDAPRLVLLGGARLDGPGPVSRFDKRTAAILAYLALEGETPRSRLAGLLWPESKERTARNNLAQALRRLRTATTVALVEGNERLSLVGVSSDVAELIHGTGRDARVSTPAAYRELLAGYDMDELPDLETWLRGARASVARAWARSVSEASEACEREGDIDEALAWAEAHVAAEPVSEQAHLRVVSLLLLRGDPPAAMRAYERCKTALARELGMTPTRAMLDVLDAIRESAARERPRKRPRDPEAVPSTLLRPPRVGRLAEWAALERAFAADVGALLSGEPGIGKSRLGRDYCTSKGAYALVEGRPADARVPYASLARALRLLLPRFDGGLAPWARAELARILPELDAENAPTSDETTLRLYEAIASALELAAERGLASLFVDDLQWIDDASAKACTWLLERCLSGELPLFAVVAHRRGELAPDRHAWIERTIGMGLLTRIDLGPLSAEEIASLVRHLELPVLLERTADVVRAAGGYPLYVLEIARSLVAVRLDGQSATEGDVPLPVNERLRSLVRHRLATLSDDALRVARVAAIAGAPFDVALVADMLETTPIDLTDAFSELERAQVVDGTLFTHDVLAESVLESLPRMVRAHLHGRAAKCLVARSDAPPATIAFHLRASGDSRAAVPHLVRAAESALALSCVDEFVRHYEDAARILEEAGDLAGASDALYRRSRAGLGDDGEAIAQRLARVARTARERGRAAFVRARSALERGEKRLAEAAARAAETFAKEARDELVEVESVQVVFDVELRERRLDAAKATLARLVERARDVTVPGAAWVRIGATFNSGELLAMRDEHVAAIERFEAAIAELEAWTELQGVKARGAAALATSWLALGRIDDAERALARIERVPTNPALAKTRAAFAIASARVQQARRKLWSARRLLVDGVALDATYDYRLAQRLLLAEIDADRGELEAARAAASSILADRCAHRHEQALAALVRARIAAFAGKAIAPEDRDTILAGGAHSALAELACLQALVTSWRRAEAHLEQAEEHARVVDLAPLRAVIAATSAVVAWRAGRMDEAAGHVGEALEATTLGALSGAFADAAWATALALSPGNERLHREALAYIDAATSDAPGAFERAAYLEANPWRSRLCPTPVDP